MKFLKAAVFSVMTLALCGCLETGFEFKTIIKSDGSVLRTLNMDGAGGNFFKAPSAPWKSRSWETRGGRVLLPSSDYHIFAEGSFKADQEIPADYEFDTAKIISSWSEADRARLEGAGIKPPFDQNVFSCNQVRIHRLQGLLTVTTVYEEVFQNANVIPLIMIDLKDEIRRQSEERGQNFQDSELEDLARLRLEEEILPQIRFRSHLEMPGEIISTNGSREGKNAVTWKFTMKDFQGGYSIYTLRASARSFKPAALLFFGAAGLLTLLLFIVAVIGMSRFKPRHYDSQPRKKEKN